MIFFSKRRKICSLKSEAQFIRIVIKMREKKAAVGDANSHNSHAQSHNKTKWWLSPVARQYGWPCGGVMWWHSRLKQKPRKSHLQSRVSGGYKIHSKQMHRQQAYPQSSQKSRNILPPLEREKWQTVPCVAWEKLLHSWRRGDSEREREKKAFATLWRAAKSMLTWALPRSSA